MVLSYLHNLGVETASIDNHTASVSFQHLET